MLDILNVASRILQCSECWSYHVKVNFEDINTTPTEPKTERDCSHRQLFRPFWGSSVWRNNQRKLWWKISAHSDLSPDLELSTPTESRHTTCLLGGKSPSVKLMSRRENKGLAKTWTEPCKNYSISDLHNHARITAYRIFVFWGRRSFIDPIYN